ncbi:MAG: DUF2442 domain-containing protein [Cyanobacteria bacterium P01_F01_bin.143]
MTKLNAQQINQQINKAIANQAKINRIEPRANKVTFNQQENRIIIDFDGGNIFSFVVDSISVISDLSQEILATVELTPSGKGLRWDEPDIDLSIIGLMMGISDKVSRNEIIA